jgi:hypothetical protein
MTQQNNGGPILTDWFPPDVKPARVGWYEVKAKWIGGYSYWSGSAWTNCIGMPDRSYEDWFNGATQSKSWRGLAEKPE